MGFTTREQMIGTHEFRAGAGPSGRHPFGFRARWGPPRLREWLNPGAETFMRCPLVGEVHVGGLCDAAPMAGTLHLDYFDHRRVRYEFSFAVGGTAYRFQGDKENIRPWNLAFSHTTCFGVLVEHDTERLVSTSISLFRFRDLPGFLAAVRPTSGRRPWTDGTARREETG